MLNVLQIIGSMNRGGAETFLMNVYRNIDRSKFHFDFVVHTSDKCDYEDELIKLGSTVYHITPMSKNLILHIRDLIQIFNSKHYDVIHRHTCTSIVFIDLMIAKMCGIKKRIVHSHNSNIDKSIVMENLHIAMRPLLNLFSTDKLTCSDEAGVWLYGEKAVLKLIYNGIDLQKYQYNVSTREEIREKYKITPTKLIVGHVGNFSYQKNHMFLLEIFKEINANNSNSELWFIGDGVMKNKIREKAVKLGIIDKLKFLGVLPNVNQVLQAMDVFIFPSHHEGMSLALIEAQISGLPCFTSDTVSSMSDITENIYHIPLSEDASVWADKIMSVGCQKDRNIDLSKENIQKFNIRNMAKLIGKIYRS